MQTDKRLLAIECATEAWSVALFEDDGMQLLDHRHETIGRGHAERCAALAWALPPERPITIFCARADIFPPLPPQASIITTPSLFEATGAEAPGLADLDTPDTLHCAPVGWPGRMRPKGV